MSHISAICKRLFAAGLLLICFASVFTGCASDGIDLLVSGDTFKLSLEDEFDYESYLEELKDRADSAAALNTESVPYESVPAADTLSGFETSASDDISVPENVVYWVKTGEVWHTRIDCSSLSRSKDIISGSVEAALQNGKTRACKRCAG